MQSHSAQTMKLKQQSITTQNISANSNSAIKRARHDTYIRALVHIWTYLNGAHSGADPRFGFGGQAEHQKHKNRGAPHHYTPYPPHTSPPYTRWRQYIEVGYEGCSPLRDWSGEGAVFHCWISKCTLQSISVFASAL